MVPPWSGLVGLNMIVYWNDFRHDYLLLLRCTKVSTLTLLGLEQRGEHSLFLPRYMKDLNVSVRCASVLQSRNNLTDLDNSYPFETE